jgi:hypothetical protein
MRRLSVSEAHRPSPVPYPTKETISKSLFLNGLQCPKLLWHAINTKDLLPEPDAAQQAIFDQGHDVGALARQLFPGGIDVCGTDRDEIIRGTTEALKLRKPLFEPAFQASGGFCRVDVLNPTQGGSWDLVEVKSSASVKHIHLQDVAFQAWVLADAGVPVRRTKLMYLDSDYVRSGSVEPQKLFTLTSTTTQTSKLGRTVGARVSDMLSIIRQPTPPEVAIGPHCDNPYTCPLHDLCWKFLPEQNVMSLYRGKKKGFKLLVKGITAIREIPETVKLTANQAVQKQCAETGKPHSNQSAIVKFLRRLRYPVHYLDFETFNTAIPLFDGVRPYQQVPFQFSLHIVNAPGAEPEQRMFLADGHGDPRPEFMRRLRECIRDKGSIVVYNAAFEKSRLRECAEFLPEHAAWVRRIERRFVDLLKPFRSFDYYHPDQCGSASIKSVLPALTGRQYDDLEIKDGSTASLEFLRVTFGDLPEVERQPVRRQLEEYCCRDTEGMIWIVAELGKLASRQPHKKSVSLRTSEAV